MTQEAQPSRKRSVGAGFGEHVRRMPRWHKQVLTLGLIIGVAGLVGQVAGFFSTHPSEDVSTESEATTAPPGVSRQLLPTSPTADVEPAKDQQWWERFSPHASRIGFSLVIGFIIGWIFRAFLKVMILLTVLGVGILVALTYFNVIDIDFSAARTQYEDSLHWLTDQANKLKEVVQARIPSTASGAFGAFLGMRRR